MSVQVLPRDDPDFGLVLKGLNLEASQVVAAFRNRMDMLVELDSVETVESLPRFVDFTTIAEIPRCRVLMVTAPTDQSNNNSSHNDNADDSKEAVDFVSRFFAPAFCVDEDPVCGSAHCCLAPYYAPKLGKANMVGRSAVHRGGIAYVGVGTAGGASADDRIALGGGAVATVQGRLMGGLPQHLFAANICTSTVTRR